MIKELERVRAAHSFSVNVSQGPCRAVTFIIPFIRPVSMSRKGFPVVGVDDGGELPRYGRAVSNSSNGRTLPKKRASLFGGGSWCFGGRRKEKDEDGRRSSSRGTPVPALLLIVLLIGGVLVWWLGGSGSQETAEVERDPDDFETRDAWLARQAEEDSKPDPLIHLSKDPLEDIKLRLKAEYGPDKVYEPPKVEPKEDEASTESEEGKEDEFKDGEIIDEGEFEEDEEGNLIPKKKKKKGSQKVVGEDQIEEDVATGDDEDQNGRRRPKHGKPRHREDDDGGEESPVHAGDLGEDQDGEKQKRLSGDDDEEAGTRRRDRDLLESLDESSKQHERNEDEVLVVPDKTSDDSDIPKPDQSHNNDPPAPEPIAPPPPPPPPPSVPQFYRDSPPPAGVNEPYIYTGPPNPDGIKMDSSPIPPDKEGMASVEKVAKWAWKAWWDLCISPYLPPTSDSNESSASLRKRIKQAKLQSQSRSYDELRPVQRVCHDWAPGPPSDGREMATNSMILTAVDSISTFAVMKLEKELRQALELCLSWDFRIDAHVSVFETTIRVLGGLLSGWALTGEDDLIDKAEQVGQGLLGAFGWNGEWEKEGAVWRWELPVGNANLKTWVFGIVIVLRLAMFADTFRWTPHSGSGRIHGDMGTSQVRISEIGTLQLEFQTLADALPAHRAKRFQSLTDFINQQIRYIETELSNEGLWPKRLGRFTRSGPSSSKNLGDGYYAIGGEIDSFYEYLLKIWTLNGGAKGGSHVDPSIPPSKDIHPPEGSADWARRMWDRSAHAFKRIMLSRFVPAQRGGGFPAPFRPPGLENAMSPVKFHAGWVSSSANGEHSQQLEHLACFAPGMFAYGAWTWPYDVDGNKTELWDWAVDTADTCFRTYWDSPTGLGAESMGIRDSPMRSTGGSFYILRPEVLESVFYVHRISGGADGRYRRWARFTVAALEKHARIASGGYAGLQDAGADPSRISHGDNQETFFLAELVKYLYLIFAGSDALDLSDWVFNTEAHPLPVKGGKRWKEIMMEGGGAKRREKKVEEPEPEREVKKDEPKKEEKEKIVDKEQRRSEQPPPKGQPVPDQQVVAPPAPAPAPVPPVPEPQHADPPPAPAPAPPPPSPPPSKPHKAKAHPPKPPKEHKPKPPHPPKKEHAPKPHPAKPHNNNNNKANKPHPGGKPPTREKSRKERAKEKREKEGKKFGAKHGGKGASRAKKALGRMA